MVGRNPTCGLSSHPLMPGFRGKGCTRSPWWWWGGNQIPGGGYQVPGEHQLPGGTPGLGEDTSYLGGTPGPHGGDQVPGGGHQVPEGHQLPGGDTRSWGGHQLPEGGTPGTWEGHQLAGGHTRSLGQLLHFTAASEIPVSPAPWSSLRSGSFGFPPMWPRTSLYSTL